MAGELIAKNTSGTTVAAQLWLGGRVASVPAAALEPYEDDHWANYAVPLVEQGTSGTFLGDMPAFLTTAGRYSVLAYEVIDSTPAGDSHIGGPSLLDWTGAAIYVPPSSVNPPGVVKIYGYEYDDNLPVMDRKVQRDLLSPPQKSGSVILEAARKSTDTDRDGYWFFYVVPGKQYRILIPEAGLDFDFTAPGIDTNLATLIT